MAQSLEQALKRKSGPVTLDELTVDTGQSPSEVQTALTLLEMGGKVRSRAGRFEWIGGAPEAPKATPKKAVQRTVKPVKSIWSAAVGNGRGLPRGAYEVTVCAKRWRDGATGRWLESPRTEYKPRKLRGEVPDRFEDGITVYRTFTRTRYGDRPRAYRVEYPAAREGYLRRELSRAQVAEMERDIAGAILAEELAEYTAQAEKLALENRHRLGAAGKRDNARKMTRPTKKLNGVATKTPNGMRTEKVRLETLGRDLASQRLKARTATSRESLERRIALNSQRLEELGRKAARAGVTL